MRAALWTFLALFLVFGLNSCGGDSAPTQPSGSPLDGVTLSVDTVEALGKVYLLGLAAAERAAQGAAGSAVTPAAKRSAHEDLEVRFLVDGVEPVTAFVEEDESGHFFRAVLHPVTPNEGGSVRVYVTDGTHASPEFAMQLEPLPAAPGAFQRLIESLRAIVEQRATWAGTSFEELAGLSFVEVPDAHLPLKVAQSYLDGAGPNDLTSLIDNAEGFLTADERELLDRMFGHARLDLVVQADIEEFEAGARSGPPEWSAAPDHLGKRACIDAGPEISTAQGLVDAMVMAALGDAALDPNGAGRYLEAVATLFTGLGTVPGPGKVFSVAGVGIAVWQAATSAVRGTYPNQLTALQYDLDKSELFEDDDVPARWSNVMLTARSSGWVADRSVVNVVISAVGAYVSVAHSTEIAELDALRDVGVAGLNAELQSHLDDNEGLIEFCPQTWTVKIDDPDFSTAAVAEGRFSVNRDAQTLEPLEVGTDVLQIATVPGLFAGQNIQRDTPIQTKPILVVVEPAVIRVEEPGEVVQITARIRDAEVTSLYWAAQHGTWQDGIGDDTNDGTTRPLETPTQANLYPFRVEVESTSQQGLRASGEPRRYDFTEIRLQTAEIRIAPRDTCIQPGDTVQFRASVVGLEDYEVVWTRGEGYGSIDQNGLYRSVAGGTSNAEISAHIAGMEEISDTTGVDARACNCFYQANLGIASFGGSDVAYLASFFGAWNYQFFFDIGSDPEFGIGLSITDTETAPAPVPGDTGTYEVNFVFINGNSSWSAASGDDDAGVLLYLEEFTETFMQGRLSGTAVQRNEQGDVISLIPVDVVFRAGNWVEGWPCE
jgi:hypothetical protein